MVRRMFRFGETPCAVTIRPVPRARSAVAWVATVEVVNERHRTRDAGVSPTMHFRAGSADAALAEAALHLESRFGPLRDAPPPDGDVALPRQPGG